jgi:hypothetical protein
MGTTPDELWADEQNWPLRPDGYCFLVPAINRIGRHLFADEWRDDFPCDEFFTAPKSVGEADANTRAWAHRVLNVILGDRYTPDFVEGGRSIADLSSGFLASLAPLGNLDSLASEDTQTLDRRERGYWFDAEQWQTFRNYLHYKNEQKKPNLLKVRRAAEWLYNRVFDGSIVPYVRHIEGGGWQVSPPDDWQMRTPEALRQRIRYCRLVPGKPAWPSGNHWIFIKIDELDRALDVEALAKRNPADEFDAAPERGDGQEHAKVEVPDGNLKAAPLTDTGLTTEAVHEAHHADVNEIYDGRATALDANGRPLRGKQLAAFIALKGAFGADLGKYLVNADRAIKMRRWVLAQKPRPSGLDRLPAKDKDLYRLFNHVDKKCF